MTKVYDTATDLITFARLQAQNTTSGSSYLGSDGLLKFAAEDEPRIEYAADGSLKGLLIEEQRTNLITESTPQSGDLATSGGSFSYVTCNFTPLSGSGIHFDTTGVTSYAYFRPTHTVDDYTFSVFVEMNDGNAPTFGSSISPDASNDFAFVIDGGPVNPASYIVEHYGGSTYRVSGTRPSVTTTVRNAGLIKYSGNSSRTFKVTGFQLEVGSFATSYIPTSGSTVTRSPDIASIPVSAFGYNQEAGTVVVEATAYAGNPNNANYASLGNAALTDFVRLWTWEGQTSHVRWTGTNFDVVIPFTSGTAEKFAGAYAQDNYNIALDGAAATPDTSGAQTLIGSVLRLGAKTSATEFLNGHIKSLSYFPRRLTDAQLQELTS